jgi:hypothetical protein
MTLLGEAVAIHVGSATATAVHLGDVKVWPAGTPLPPSSGVASWVDGAELKLVLPAYSATPSIYDVPVFGAQLLHPDRALGLTSPALPTSRPKLWFGSETSAAQTISDPDWEGVTNADAVARLGGMRISVTWNGPVSDLTVLGPTP